MSLETFHKSLQNVLIFDQDQIKELKSTIEQKKSESVSVTKLNKELVTAQEKYIKHLTNYKKWAQENKQIEEYNIFTTNLKSNTSNTNSAVHIESENSEKNQIISSETVSSCASEINAKCESRQLNKTLSSSIKRFRKLMAGNKIVLHNRLAEYSMKEFYRIFKLPCKSPPTFMLPKLLYPT